MLIANKFLGLTLIIIEKDLVHYVIAIQKKIEAMDRGNWEELDILAGDLFLVKKNGDDSIVYKRLAKGGLGKLFYIPNHQCFLWIWWAVYQHEEIRQNMQQRNSNNTVNSNKKQIV